MNNELEKIKDELNVETVKLIDKFMISNHFLSYYNLMSKIDSGEFVSDNEKRLFSIYFNIWKFLIVWNENYTEVKSSAMLNAFTDIRFSNTKPLEILTQDKIVDLCSQVTSLRKTIISRNLSIEGINSFDTVLE